MSFWQQWLWGQHWSILSHSIAQAVLEVLHKFFAPIYILFFVLVGARVSFAHVNKVIWMLVVAYVAGSISGKTLGAYLGGVCSACRKNNQKITWAFVCIRREVLRWPC